MTIYRIHPDRMHYQLMTISSEQVISKLGREYPFHIDPAPKTYAHIWKPIEVSFYDSSSGKVKAKQPDITVSYGRLFLSEVAYAGLASLIREDGEALPITVEGGGAIIFNPLKIAENFGALDTKCSIRNEWGDLQSLEFFEDKIDSAALFRCEFEGFTGLFCNEKFKELVEKLQLNGVVFSADLGNIFPVDPSANLNKKRQ